MEQSSDRAITSLAATVAPLSASMGTKERRATGFFYRNGTHLFLITNRHVVLKEDEEWKADKVSLRIHVDPKDLTKNSELVLPLYKSSEQLWRALDPQVDLAAIEVEEQNLSSLGNVVIHTFSSKDLPPDDMIVELGEDLLILGYPLGFHDDVFNLPVVRSAAIASVYPVPFRRMPYFLVDARAFKGNSGSPVILSTNMIANKAGVG